MPQSVRLHFRAPHKTGAGFRSLLTTQAHNPPAVFLCVLYCHVFFASELWGAYGADFGRAGFLCSRYCEPVRLATHSFAALDGEFSQLTNKGPHHGKPQTTPRYRGASSIQTEINRRLSRASRVAQIMQSICCMSAATHYQTFIPPLF